MSKIKQAEEFVFAALKTQIEIDDMGRIWRVADRHGRILATPVLADRAAASGYRNIRAMADGKRMTALSHRVVWLAINGPIPPGLTINHKNGCKSDNAPSNLELATDSDQMQHATRVLKRGKAAHQNGERNPYAKLTDAQAQEIREARATGLTCSAIAARYGVTYQQVWRIARGLSRSTG